MTAATVKTNLRNQQRADVVSDIVIEKPDGCLLTCKIANLSRTGVMISCDQETVSQLIPRLKVPAPGNLIVVKARFSVPVTPSQPVSIVANGTVVHLRRMARNEFKLGIQFVDFEDNGFDYVDTYVRKLLARSL
ncbi:MAG: PilZ domain-containing protein [Marinobacter sp.]|uniref:PilZ domain-containing protein n=1 Tax=Marinobacter sp. TaxID=50741 RepID=UPI003F9DEF50